MVNFEDLSPEDQERLLEQAKSIINDENIKKDAITVYKIKKKELVDQCLNEIYTGYEVRYETERETIKSRFAPILNYLHKVNFYKQSRERHSKFPPNIVISNAEEWEKFEKIITLVKELFLKCKNI